MNKPNVILLFIFTLLILSCKEEKHSFPTEKRFWNINDYKSASLELNYGYEDDEKLPSFDDPETNIIVKKLVDHENYKVVLDDNELGLKHRNQEAEAFFSQWKDMINIYQGMDLKDNYIYDKENIAVYEFGLGLQLRYFKLGNDELIELVDDPNSLSTLNRINSNVQTLIENFNNYLDKINEEKSYSDEGITMIAKGIGTYFTQLVNLYPDANYSNMSKKIELMSDKSNSEEIKKALDNLKNLIESKNIKNNISEE
ncbi:hypothetical protein H0I23_05460 [Cellulophaga sp. HaHaR_3_176]|uniref:hypothetical protein n=1 Tax=Cellulophaga sp. HaHaR_3_176 TaxID=1942464 RepID=UPI001C1F834D|nr:hypothetical protein [Cellulophaga sp. HaHaR_3_176]QWX85084.1 hypothetical protein H0I23_05460 [Cellulophaga sp. HaHaR_3_176]